MTDERRLEIAPRPSAAERAAIAAALSSRREDPRREVSAWWRAGVSENVGETDAESEPAD